MKYYSRMSPFIRKHSVLRDRIILLTNFLVPVQLPVMIALTYPYRRFEFAIFSRAIGFFCSDAHPAGRDSFENDEVKRKATFNAGLDIKNNPLVGGSFSFPRHGTTGQVHSEVPSLQLN